MRRRCWIKVMGGSSLEKKVLWGLCIYGFLQMFVYVFCNCLFINTSVNF